jgi:YHS domain-containing protein
LSKTAIDPVCKMTVDIATAPATAEFEGVTQYFCMTGCKDQFTENPRKFLPAEGDAIKGWKKFWHKK